MIATVAAKTLLLAATLLATSIATVDFAHQSGTGFSQANAGSFAGRQYPVRNIEYDTSKQSGAPLKQVRCPRHAKSSSCYVATITN
ncbi:MAG: hypothetical protein ACRDLM_04750 [Gaiellaceae bacterium]